MVSIRQPAPPRYNDGGRGSDARLLPAAARSSARRRASGDPDSGYPPGAMSGRNVRDLLLHLQRVLDRRERRKLDGVELALALLDLADIDVLDDLAGFRIDRDRAARAFPLGAFHRPDQRVGVGLAAGLLDRLVDQMHAVVAAERDEVWPISVGLLECLDIGLVGGRVVQD